MARKKYFLELQKTTDFSAFLEFFHNHKVRRLDEKYNMKKSKGYENSLLPLVLFFSESPVTTLSALAFTHLVTSGPTTMNYRQIG